MGKARGRWYGPCSSGRRRAESSGNTAFDEYRAETMRRLEEEQNEFVNFLDRLRQAKDKAEFDQFMAERRNAPPSSSGEAPGQQQG
jgi:glutathione synthase/RimK-type ligase-like ATP-grasp enzyme